MNAQAFREYYDYHFSENRKIWDRYIVVLLQEQFVQDIDDWVCEKSYHPSHEC